MNKIYALFMIPLLSIMSIGQAPYLDDATGFTIRFPKGWSVEKNPVALIVSRSPEKNDLGRPAGEINVSVSKLSAGTTLDAFLKGSVSAYGSIWEIEKTVDVTSGNKKGKKIYLEQTLGTVTKKLIKMYIVSGSQVFIVSCSANPEDFHYHSADFEKSLASFKLP